MSLFWPNPRLFWFNSVKFQFFIAFPFIPSLKICIMNGCLILRHPILCALTCMQNIRTLKEFLTCRKNNAANNWKQYTTLAHVMTSVDMKMPQQIFAISLGGVSFCPPGDPSIWRWNCLYCIHLVTPGQHVCSDLILWLQAIYSGIGGSISYSYLNATGEI